MLLDTYLVELIKLLLRAYQENSDKLRKVFWFFPFGLVLIVGGYLSKIYNWIDRPLSVVLIGSGILIIFIAITAIAGYQQALDDKKKEKELSERQAKAFSEPEKVRLVWDLAQEKLESYVDRNLKHIRTIFTLCSFVMLVGFTFVVAGTIMVYNDQRYLSPSILSAVSGVLISFLGGTFLFLYNSLMSQSKEYVSMLERINAVGMSLQIVDGISDDNKFKRDEVRAHIAGELLKLYKENRVGEKFTACDCKAQKT